MRTRVKICGITRAGDAASAVSAGVDAIGLVFYPQSPRYVAAHEAARVVSGIGPFVTVTGLFVDADPVEISAVLSQVPLALLQFHGSERNADCVRFGLPFIKSIAMRPDTDCLRLMDEYPDASGFLLDTWQPDLRGGSGRAFDWELVPKGLDRPVILAGGLAPENVAEAIRRVRPYAVDVSSGVESAPGIKSAERIRAFLTGVQVCESDSGNQHRHGK
jgi:phosphoribosylanthranilate isomerase